MNLKCVHATAWMIYHALDPMKLDRIFDLLCLEYRKTFQRNRLICFRLWVSDCQKSRPIL